jgi:hypothetical protein
MREIHRVVGLSGGDLLDRTPGDDDRDPDKDEDEDEDEQIVAAHHDVILGTPGADDVAHGKPAPAPVRQARELAGVPSERAVFVGDTFWYMEAAGAHALYCDDADLLVHLDSGVFADKE